MHQILFKRRNSEKVISVSYYVCLRNLIRKGTDAENKEMYKLVPDSGSSYADDKVLLGLVPWKLEDKPLLFSGLDTTVSLFLKELILVLLPWRKK